MARLGEICSFQSGGTPSRKNPEFYNGSIPWITTVALNGEMIDESNAVDMISEKAIKNSTAKIVPPHSIMVGTRVGIGKVAINSVPMSTSQDVVSLVGIDESAWDKEYLIKFLQGKSAYLISQSRGATIKGIKIEILADMELPQHALPTQRRIATTLNKVSEGIALCKQMMVDLDDLVKSQFVEMFGDPVKNTRNLPTDTLANLGELNRGVSKSRPRNLPELLGGPYPLVQTGEVSNCDLYINHYESTYSKLGLAQSKMWPKGTLCITIAANIAQTGILDFDACFPDSVVGFINGDRVTQIFIHYWFSFFQKILDEQAPQVAQKNINLQILRDLSVVVPLLEEQKAFDEFVKQAYKSKLAVQQQLAELETLKKSLMQEYFG